VLARRERGVIGMLVFSSGLVVGVNQIAIGE
jgi:hypothetical protein